MILPGASPQKDMRGSDFELLLGPSSGSEVRYIPVLDPRAAAQTRGYEAIRPSWIQVPERPERKNR